MSRQEEQITNPITMGFNLVEGYQQLLRMTLSESGLSDAEVSHILKHLDDVGVDNQLFFSLNRKYKPAAEPFDVFCRQYLSEALFSAVYNSAPEAKRIRRLHAHQAKGIRHITAGQDTIIATGTGSGKTETFLFPVIDYCLKHAGGGVKALIIYPMNALANDQLGRLAKLVQAAREGGRSLRYGSFTGLTPSNEQDARKKGLKIEPLSDGHVLFRDEMRANPPDILITNYVMLERMLTRAKDRGIFAQAHNSLQYVVLDELHTYRGNNATHLRGLLRRLVHAVSRRPVFIGTSATLTAGGPREEIKSSDGYLTKAEQSEIDAFIKPLLDTDHYELVLPEYEPLVRPESVRPIPVLSCEADLGWDMRFDEAAGLRKVSLLTGEKLTDLDLESEDGEPPRVRVVLASNAFVVALTEALQAHPLSFREIVQLLQPLLPAGAPDAVDVAKAYLSAIAFVNHAAEGDALLDFRIHLFLKDLGGYLQSCIRCGHYHSGKQEVCGACGWPLFMVHRSDIHEVVGKVSGHTLRRQLGRESDDPEVTFLTRIRMARPGPRELKNSGSTAREPLRFSETAPATAEAIQLEYDEGGGLALSLIPRDTYERGEDLSIPLVSGRKDHQYLLNLVTTILQSQTTNDRKLLGFIDNREHASRYVAILRDELAGEYFEALLRLYRADLGLRSLPDALTYALDRAAGEALSEAERRLLTELPAWLARELSRVPRRGLISSGRSLFRLEAPPKAGPALLESFSALQRQIIELFFEERAIDKRFLARWLPEVETGEQDDSPEDRAIKFQRYLVWQHHGIAFEGQSAASKRFTSIALSARSQVYKQFIEAYGEDAVQEAVRSLTDDGTSPRLPLVMRVVEEGETPKAHFYLKPEWVRLELAPSECRDYGDVRRLHYFTAGLHSSDIQGEDRATAEQGFQDGTISFLLATPTLEMGVDIGQLKTVLLVGVPPMPSNYAQRAGRAGRKQKDRYALIVTFCTEDSNHDRYYFDRPREMIAGYISPPSFDPCNVKVLKKHVHAIALRDIVDGQEVFLANARRIQDRLPAMIEEAEQVFGDVFDVRSYLRGDFVALVDDLAQRVTRASRAPLQLFYDEGIFPDYGFRRDEVTVLDFEAARRQKIDLQEAYRRHEREVFEKLRVTGRDPEQAYYKLYPGETVFMAGDAFSIGDDSPFFRVLESIEGQEVRSYEYLYGYRSDDPSRDREIARYDRKVWLTPSQSAQDKVIAGLLGVAYHPFCMLSFRNQGVIRAEGVTQSGQMVGYDLSREALVFSLPSELCTNSRLFVSLLSALDRSIKDTYGLDEGDLRLLIDVSVVDGEETEDTTQARAFVHAVLYDASGNGNAPLARIYDELGESCGALQRAYDRMLHCPNEDCEHGCYLCLRSYSTHFYAAEVEKETALMMVGYLLGKNPFVPQLSLPKPATNGRVDLALEVDLRGTQVTVQSLDRTYVEEVTDGQNLALFAALARGARNEHAAGRACLRVVVRRSVGYLSDFINKGKLGQQARREEKQAFEQMFFDLLRYSSVHAVPYEQL